MQNRKQLIWATCMGLFLSACTGPLITPESASLSAEILLRAEPLTGAQDVPDLPDVDVLALNQEMLAFLDEQVDRKQGRQDRLRALLHAIIAEGQFGLEYDETTRTAEETFAARLGNCLSFTNMFVAMARELGLKASYQEVEILPIWSMDEDTYVLSRHVNVHLELGAGKIRQVDFNIGDFRGSYDRQTISDNRALAHYYTNIAAEYMQTDKPLMALQNLRKAEASDPQFAPVWSNLGVLYSQAGHYSHAEAAYLRALQIDARELAAMSNLGQLYSHLGETENADWYNQKSHLHRMRNPYYRYQLAQDAFHSRDYDDAIEHLEYAVKKRDSEDSFYFLMGLSYLQKGDESNAYHWLKKAEQAASDDAMRQSYHSKLDTLFGAG